MDLTAVSMFFGPRQISLAFFLAAFFLAAHEVAGVQISIQPKGNAVVLKGPSDRIQFFDLLSDQSVYQVTSRGARGNQIGAMTQSL